VAITAAAAINIPRTRIVIPGPFSSPLSEPSPIFHGRGQGEGLLLLPPVATNGRRKTEDPHPTFSRRREKAQDRSKLAHVLRRCNIETLETDATMPQQCAMTSSTPSSAGDSPGDPSFVVALAASMGIDLPASIIDGVGANVALLREHAARFEDFVPPADGGAA
jgi:hypothetical protein